MPKSCTTTKTAPATVLCSYSHTVRDLFLSINAYHFPCSYKPVFLNNALMSLHEIDCEKEGMKLPKRSRTAKSRKRAKDAPCTAVQYEGDRNNSHLHACRQYSKSGLRADQFLVFDTTKGKTNSSLNPWKVGEGWDTDDIELLHACSGKTKDRTEDQWSPLSTRQTASALPYSSCGQNDKRNSGKANEKYCKPDSAKSSHSWSPKSMSSVDLVCPFQHDLSWSQYAHQYRERKGLINYNSNNHSYRAKSAGTVYRNKSDLQKTMKRLSSIDLTYHDTDAESYTNKTEEGCVTDRSTSSRASSDDRMTLKGNLMNLHLPGSNSPDVILKVSSSEHKRVSLKGKGLRHELKLLHTHKPSNSPEHLAKDLILKTESPGMVTVCRNKPTVPTNQLGKVCATSYGTQSYTVKSQKYAEIGTKSSTIKAKELAKRKSKAPLQNDGPCPTVVTPPCIMIQRY